MPASAFVEGSERAGGNRQVIELFAELIRSPAASVGFERARETLELRGQFDGLSGRDLGNPAAQPVRVRAMIQYREFQFQSPIRMNRSRPKR